MSNVFYISPLKILSCFLCHIVYLLFSLGAQNLSRIDEAKGIIDKMKVKFPDKIEGWKEVKEVGELRGTREDVR
jgi:hypothetical protein